MSSKKQPDTRFVKKDDYVLAPESADFVDSTIYALSGGGVQLTHILKGKRIISQSQ